jgi:signal transduction histidine kinase
MRGMGDVVRRMIVRYGVRAVAVALALTAAISAAGYPSGPVIAAAALSAFTAGSLSLLDRSPLAMAGLFGAGLLALSAVGIGTTPMWAFIALLLVSFWTTDRLPARQAWWAIGWLFASGVVFDARSGEGDLVSHVLSPLVIVGGPALAGALLRRSRSQAARLRELSTELAAQRDAAAATAELAERARIAREIHDVVAHTVSVMLVQAGAADEMLEPDHPAIEPVRAIRDTGKQALAELRRVIGVLRSATPDDIHPQPGLADLQRLINAARNAGADIRFDIGPEVDDLPAGLQLTAFRVVQEALTNARKHATDASVSVLVHRDSGFVHLVIEDDGSAQPTGADPGYGLAGLRERARLYGAELQAGPREDHPGWRVRLDLPAPAPSAVRQTAAS